LKLFLCDSVPISKLPELVYETKKDVANSGLVAPIVGHVGDGNFHALILFKTDEEKIKAKELVHRMVKRAIALDGTCRFFFVLQSAITK
jgi:D-lactate dehydrogenase (cytochrome)